MSVRLKYRIVKVSSEDPEFPASEILVHSSQTKGWQSARFCEFAQELGLQFETPVHLRQIQFLSHQSKIASKIELFTAMSSPKDGANISYNSAKFTRLGYLSLDSNERSQFQARELKSVYVDVQALFLKILLHKCHINKYNLVNQVGLIALNCLGEPLGPDLSMGPPPSVHRNGSASTTPTNAMNAEDTIPVQFDPQTSERMRALIAAKKRAVELEDYDEAKRCKDMIVRLKSVGHALSQLEEKKRLAVSNEDYDTAKALKSEVERLRQAVESTDVNNRDARPLEPASPSPKGYGAAGAPPGGPRMASPGAGGFGAASPRDQGFDYPPSAAMPYGRGPADREMPRDQPRDFRDDTSRPGTVSTREGGIPDPGLTDPRPSVNDPGPSEEFQDGEHPLKRVPNYEQLSTPEALAPAMMNDAQSIIPIFGEYLARCIYSKTWNLREAALIKMDLELNAGKWEGQDPRTLLQAFNHVLKRTFLDKIPQVFLTSQHLLLSLSQGIFTDLKKADVQPALEVLFPLLLERLGDVNARCSAAAREAVIALAACPAVGPVYSAQGLLKPLKKDKKNVPSRVLVARLTILRQLATDYGWQPARKDGVPLEASMSLAMQWFSNPSGDVRNACVALVGAAYQDQAAKVEPFLKDLRPAQRDVFDAEFERLGLEGDGYATRDAEPIHGDDGQEEPRQCQFCGLKDSIFTAAALDMHYWKDCPMLIQCVHCQQVVELMSVMEHLELECEARP